MLTITFMSMKGGTGKSTCAAWLAAAYHDIGRKVVLVDADPTRSVCAWNDLAAARDGGPMPFPVLGLAGRDMRERVRYIFGRTGPYSDKRYTGTEVLIIDCGQAENHKQLAQGAVWLADEVVIPVSPTPIELDRTAPARRFVLGPSEGVPARPREPRVSVLLNRCVTNALSTGEARTALTGIGLHVLTSQIQRLEMYALSWGSRDLPTSGTAFEQLAYELLAREGAR